MVPQNHPTLRVLPCAHTAGNVCPVAVMQDGVVPEATCPSERRGGALPLRLVRGLAQNVVDLFGHPGGWATEPMALVLNVFNGRGNALASEVLGAGPGDVVLEVGIGGGAAIARTTTRLGSSGALYGIDLSADMVNRARRAFRSLVGQGMLRLACADVAHLPLRGASMDYAYAMHSHMYWPDPLAGVEEMVRVLRPEGRLMLAQDVRSGLRLIKMFGPSYDPLGPDRLLPLLEQAGLVDVEERRVTVSLVAVVGTKPK